MNEIIEKIPRPVLIFLVLTAGILFFIYSNPPHSICDTELEIFLQNQKGTIFKSEEKKKKVPPLLTQAKKLCKDGNSPGACYEYVKALRGVAKGIGDATLACRTEIFSQEEIKKALIGGITLLSVMAWGELPPETTGNDKLGWLSEFEVSTYCLLKETILSSGGEEEWASLRSSVLKLFPAERIDLMKAQEGVERKKAIEVMSEQEVFSKSLFSIRCENFN